MTFPLTHPNYGKFILKEMLFQWLGQKAASIAMDRQCHTVNAEDTRPCY